MTTKELARHLDVSISTVRRWYRGNQVPYTKNAKGWPMYRVKDIPPDLIAETKKLSAGRLNRKPTADAELDDEILFLRAQLAEAMAIIRQLSGVEHLSNTFPDEAEQA